MENRKLIDRDEIYFLVFFSNFFIGMLLLTIKYNFDSIQAFFVFQKPSENINCAFWSIHWASLRQRFLLNDR